LVVVGVDTAHCLPTVTHLVGGYGSLTRTRLSVANARRYELPRWSIVAALRETATNRWLATLASATSAP
jgi:hypothetical protein